MAHITYCTFKAANSWFFLVAVCLLQKQAVNTTLTYYPVGKTVRKQFIIYTSRRWRATLAFVWSHVSDEDKFNIQSPFSSVLVFTNS